ncbi:MAG: P-II family nitrogen regulator [Planctomycetes bacterium]|nr:P-II family nitrogen regulator [Planctomycetota bacterium]
MLLIRAIVRPEKATAVMSALFEKGFPSVTKLSVYGRGKQRGLKVGDITYDELSKTMLMMVVNDSDKDGISDNIEIKNGTNPNKTDSDEDDLTDLDELNRSTNPLNSDTDGDGYKDGAEINGGFDPLGPGKLKK